MQLTDEAKEELGVGVKLRLKVAVFCIDAAHRILPQAYWDGVHKKEIKKIAERYGMKVVDEDYDPRDDPDSNYTGSGTQ